ncbi:MAG: S-methyl-5'-thioadenosine phosphorylase [Spirochaetota bacterium]
MESVKLAFIGGTGLYRIEGMEIIDTVDINTPFGKPSDSIVISSFKGKKALFLPRHGVGHRLLPSEIPVKANIWALKKLGAQKVVAISAVGSLKEEIRPRDLVVPDQLIDRTRLRPASFFGSGIVGHVSFADPFCPELSMALSEAAEYSGYRVHKGGTYVCMEGPAFSTRAESRLYRTWGGSIIGMTAIPEAKLAREAELCYAILALCTDYDCWKEDEVDVTIEMVVENLRANAEAARIIIKRLIETLQEDKPCRCQEAAKYAIITAKEYIPEDVRKPLELFYGKYWKEG